MQVYKASWCTFYARGRCTRGVNCSFAHTPEELRQLPDLRKTKLCNVFLNGQCSNSSCNYAHGLDELRDFPGKKGLCRLFREGKCFHGRRCKYAHTLRELEVGFVFGDSTARTAATAPSLDCADHDSGENRRTPVTSCSPREVGPRRPDLLRKKTAAQASGGAVTSEQVSPPPLIDPLRASYDGTGDGWSTVPHLATTPVESSNHWRESHDIEKGHDRAQESLGAMNGALHGDHEILTPVRPGLDRRKIHSKDAAERSSVVSPYHGDSGVGSRRPWFFSVSEQRHGAPEEHFPSFSSERNSLQKPSHAGAYNQKDSSLTPRCRQIVSGGDLPQPRLHTSMGDPCEQDGYRAFSPMSSDEILLEEKVNSLEEKWLLDGRLSTSTAASFSNRVSTPASSPQTEEASLSARLLGHTGLELILLANDPDKNAQLRHPQSASVDEGLCSVPCPQHAESQASQPFVTASDWSPPSLSSPQPFRWSWDRVSTFLPGHSTELPLHSPPSLPWADHELQQAQAPATEVFEPLAEPSTPKYKTPLARVPEDNQTLGGLSDPSLQVSTGTTYTSSRTPPGGDVPRNAFLKPRQPEANKAAMIADIEPAWGGSLFVLWEQRRERQLKGQVSKPIMEPLHRTGVNPRVKETGSGAVWFPPGVCDRCLDDSRTGVSKGKPDTASLDSSSHCISCPEVSRTFSPAKPIAPTLSTAELTEGETGRRDVLDVEPSERSLFSAAGQNPCTVVTAFDVGSTESDGKFLSADVTPRGEKDETAGRSLAPAGVKLVASDLTGHLRVALHSGTREGNWTLQADLHRLEKTRMSFQLPESRVRNTDQSELGCSLRRTASEGREKAATRPCYHLHSLFRARSHEALQEISTAAGSRALHSVSPRNTSLRTRENSNASLPEIPAPPFSRQLGRGTTKTARTPSRSKPDVPEQELLPFSHKSAENHPDKREPALQIEGTECVEKVIQPYVARDEMSSLEQQVRAREKAGMKRPSIQQAGPLCAEQLKVEVTQLPVRRRATENKCSAPVQTKGRANLSWTDETMAPFTPKNSQAKRDLQQTMAFNCNTLPRDGTATKAENTSSDLGIPPASSDDSNWNDLPNCLRFSWPLFSPCPFLEEEDSLGDSRNYFHAPRKPDHPVKHRNGFIVPDKARVDQDELSSPFRQPHSLDQLMFLHRDLFPSDENDTPTSAKSTENLRFSQRTIPDSTRGLSGGSPSRCEIGDWVLHVKSESERSPGSGRGVGDSQHRVTTTSEGPAENTFPRFRPVASWVEAVPRQHANTPLSLDLPFFTAPLQNTSPRRILSTTSPKPCRAQAHHSLQSCSMDPTCLVTDRDCVELSSLGASLEKRPLEKGLKCCRLTVARQRGWHRSERRRNSSPLEGISRAWSRRGSSKSRPSQEHEGRHSGQNTGRTRRSTSNRTQIRALVDTKRHRQRVCRVKTAKTGTQVTAEQVVFRETEAWVERHVKVRKARNSTLVRGTHADKDTSRIQGAPNESQTVLGATGDTSPQTTKAAPVERLIDRFPSTTHGVFMPCGARISKAAGTVGSRPRARRHTGASRSRKCRPRKQKPMSRRGPS